MHKAGAGVALVTALLCAGCATGGVQAPATPAPERLNFDGTLDLTGKGVGFSLAHASGLTCRARYESGRLPEAVTLPLGCTEQQTEFAGTLAVVKAADLRGAVTLADGRVGDVVFVRPAAAPVVAAPVTSPPPLVSAPPPVPVTVTVAPPLTVVVVPGPVVHTGPIRVRSHYRRGGHVRGHYRAGRYVRPHYRSGTTVRAHARRRR